MFHWTGFSTNHAANGNTLNAAVAVRQRASGVSVHIDYLVFLHQDWSFGVIACRRCIFNEHDVPYAEDLADARVEASLSLETLSRGSLLIIIHQGQIILRRGKIICMMQIWSLLINSLRYNSVYHYVQHNRQQICMRCLDKVINKYWCALVPVGASLHMQSAHSLWDCIRTNSACWYHV
jgi:hypothetical protein